MNAIVALPTQHAFFGSGLNALLDQGTTPRVLQPINSHRPGEDDLQRLERLAIRRNLVSFQSVLALDNHLVNGQDLRDITAYVDDVIPTLRERLQAALVRDFTAMESLIADLGMMLFAPGGGVRRVYVNQRQFFLV